MPAASVSRLIRCVRSGPNFPWAVVPLMVWQLTHDVAKNTSRPACTCASATAGCCCAATHLAKSSGSCTMTRSSMRACWVPQYSAQLPREVPTCFGSIHMRLTRFGIRSVFPASCGTQKLCATSADSNRRKVSWRLDAVLTGTCSSFAVTRPSAGYRTSHHH